LNFSERIWPNRPEAIDIIKRYLATDPLVKISEDDCYRLFAAMKSEDYIFDFFHAMGAQTICLTKGKKGVVLSDKIRDLFFKMHYRSKKLKTPPEPAMPFGPVFFTLNFTKGL
jgi:fructokinase